MRGHVNRCRPDGKQADTPGVFSFVCSTDPPVWNAPVASLPPWLLADPLGPPVDMLFRVDQKACGTNNDANDSGVPAI